LTEFLVNERIRARTIRLIEGDQQVGVFQINEALALARKQALDLVQIAPGDPPVCRILDADRFRFERAKSEREQARRQREMMIDTKEIQLRPVTDDNDMLVKAKRARAFLEEGDKVKVTVRFRGRERTHRSYGRQMIERFLLHVGEHKIDKPMRDGDSDLTIILASVIPKSEVVKQRVKSS
jgi:translation initiation factor IF-3